MASVGLSVTKYAVVATAEGSVFTDAVYDAAEGASEVNVNGTRIGEGMVTAMRMAMARTMMIMTATTMAVAWWAGGVR